MSITPEEVKKLASLSRLELSEQELESMRKDIAGILGYIDQLKNAKFESDSSVGESLRKNVWRDDKLPNNTGEYTESLLSNAPNREGDYVKVKTILG